MLNPRHVLAPAFAVAPSSEHRYLRRTSLIRPSKIFLTITVAFMCVILHGAGSCVRAQESTATAREMRDRGIELYNRSDIEGSIKTLQAAVKLDKGDADGWYYLGRSFAARNDIKNARQAFEKAVGLRPGFTDARAALAYMLLFEKKDVEAAREAEFLLRMDERNADAHYVLGELRFYVDNGRTALAEAEKALAARPVFALALLLKAKAVRTIISFEYPTANKDEIAAFVAKSKETVASMDSFLKQNPSPANAESWREVLSVLRPYAESNFEGFVYRPEDVTQKAKIISKPVPTGGDGYGVVVLQAILRANGEVDGIRVVSSPGDRLTEHGIKAARKIKFIPAMKDGRAVSQYIRIEYHFG